MSELEKCEYPLTDCRQADEIITAERDRMRGQVEVLREALEKTSGSLHFLLDNFENAGRPQTKDQYRWFLEVVRDGIAATLAATEPKEGAGE